MACLILCTFHLHWPKGGVVVWISSARSDEEPLVYGLSPRAKCLLFALCTLAVALGLASPARAQDATLANTRNPLPSRSDLQAKIDADRLSLENLQQALDDLEKSHPDSWWQSASTIFFLQSLKALGGTFVRVAGDAGGEVTKPVQTAYETAQSRLDSIESPGNTSAAAGVISGGTYARSLALEDKVHADNWQRASTAIGALSDVLHAWDETNEQLRKKPQDQNLVEAAGSLVKAIAGIAEVVGKEWKDRAKIGGDIIEGFGEETKAVQKYNENQEEDRKHSEAVKRAEDNLRRYKATLQSDVKILEAQQDLERSSSLADALRERNWVAVRDSLKEAANQGSSDVLNWLFANASLYTGDISNAANGFVQSGSGCDGEVCQRWVKSQVSVRGENPTLLLLLGDALVREGKYLEALAVFNRGLASSPGDVLLLNARASLYTLMNRSDAAQVDFHKAFPGSYSRCGGEDEPPCTPPVQFPCPDGTPHPCTCGQGHPCPPSAHSSPPPCPPSLCGDRAVSGGGGRRCEDGSCDSSSSEGPRNCSDGSRPPCRGGVYMRSEVHDASDLDFSRLSGSVQPQGHSGPGSGLSMPTLLYSNMWIKE